MMWTVKSLLEFEQDIAREFSLGKIKAPVHLAEGNERESIRIFKSIREKDWILCSWRSHYHALLKGVPAEDVRQAIMDGRSIALCFPQYRMLSSAIVGGIGPIAVGLAWGIKRSGGDEVVNVFVGDMTAETGIYHEAAKYAANHRLPVVWHIEDNGMSVCTDTIKAWGQHRMTPSFRYHYDLKRPHVGIGKWVSF